MSFAIIQLDSHKFASNEGQQCYAPQKSIFITNAMQAMKASNAMPPPPKKKSIFITNAMLAMKASSAMPPKKYFHYQCNASNEGQQFYAPKKVFSLPMQC